MQRVPHRRKQHHYNKGEAISTDTMGPINIPGMQSTFKQVVQFFHRCALKVYLHQHSRETVRNHWEHSILLEKDAAGIPENPQVADIRKRGRVHVGSGGRYPRWHACQADTYCAIKRWSKRHCRKIQQESNICRQSDTTSLDIIDCRNGMAILDMGTKRRIWQV